MHLQIFPIPVTNIKQARIGRFDSHRQFQISPPWMREIRGRIKFLFREKDVDNNKQRIRSIEKQNFYFHHPLPSSVQPRRVRIYGTKEKENHAGEKKKKQEKRGRRELEENNCTERSFEFLFHTCQSSKRTISAQPSISKRPRAGSYAPNDINPISSVPT